MRSHFSFPFDHQLCKISFRSFSFQPGQVRYHWSNTSQPVEVGGDLEAGQDLALRGYSLQRSTAAVDGEQRSQLDLVLHFGRFECCREVGELGFCFADRPLGYYLIEIYTPAVFIVIISWLNFWLSRGAVPARITLGVTTVLTIITLKAQADASLPHTAYLKVVQYLLYTFTHSLYLLRPPGCWDLPLGLLSLHVRRSGGILSCSLP